MKSCNGSNGGTTGSPVPRIISNVFMKVSG